MLKTMKNERASATFDTRGVHLQSFQVDGKEYLWQRDPKYWAKTAPVLFPYIGAVPDAAPVEIYGKPVQMPRHGFIKDTEMTCVKDEATCQIYETSDNDVTWEMYPFHFKFTACYELQEEKLVLSYTVENTGEEEMPFVIGGHPAFFCPMNEGEQFSDYEIIFNRKENDPALIDGQILPLSYELFPIDAHIVDDCNSDMISLVHKESGRGIEFEFDPFKMMAIWSPPHKNAPFVCLEPWNNGTFETLQNVEFTEKKHLQRLQAGEKKTYRFSIKPV
ncbi:MAG: aldose 1-epimerase family protein [Hespellia sp.]|nr:aldose 1-epimerase family protein [Hespellia sp.]